MESSLSDSKLITYMLTAAFYTADSADRTRTQENLKGHMFKNAAHLTRKHTKEYPAIVLQLQAYTNHNQAS